VELADAQSLAELAREVRRRLTIIAVAVVCGLAGREILGR